MKTVIALVAVCSPLALLAQFPLPSNVPVDGGVSLVLAAGAGIGYRSYKKRKENRQGK